MLCSLASSSPMEWGYATLKLMGDSKLIINQVKGEYEVRHEDLVPYYHTAIELASLFEGFYIGHVSRSQNTKRTLSLH